MVSGSSLFSKAGGFAGLAQQAVRVTTLDQLMSRFSAVFNGKDGQFSPGDPIPPVVPDTEPKRQQFQVGGNLVVQPRSGFQSSFDMLRFFATQYSTAAICINTRIETLAGLDWKFVPRDKSAQRSRSKKFQADIDRVQAFWDRPDRQNDRAAWLRMALRDRLEIDALTLYPRKNRGGGLYALEILDGATIKVLVDARGRVPDPPAPAYQQVLWGVPRSLWSSEQVLYCPQNVQTYSVYGRAEAETILMVVNTALRKQTQDLLHFTDSNVPRALVSTPAAWTPTQIEQFQEFWDNWLSGDQARRSKMILAPGTGSAGRLGVYEFSSFSGDTVFDTWLLKLTCAAYQVTPTEIGFTEDSNKATASTEERVQARGGTNPLAKFISGIVDRVNRDYLDAGHLKHEWDTGEEEDDLTLAQVDQIYGTMSVTQPDEMRERLGLEPYGLKPFLLVNGKPILVEDFEAYAKANLQEEILIASAGPGAPGGVASQSLASGSDAPPSAGGPSSQDPRDPSLPSTSPSSYSKVVDPETGAPYLTKADELAEADWEVTTVAEFTDQDVETAKAVVTDVLPWAKDPPVDTHAARDDLRRWRSKVLKSVKAGQPVPPFVSTVIPEPLVDVVRSDLSDLVKTAYPDREEFVRSVFDSAIEALVDEVVQKADTDEVVVDFLELEKRAVASATGWESWEDAWSDAAEV